MVTADEQMLDDAQGLFDHLWRGRECKGCRLRKECGAPIADLPELRRRADPRAPRS
jgi:hypothetical protein